MKRLTFSRLARDDLLDIGLYISADSPVRAKSFLLELRDKGRQIAEWPNAFPERRDISPGLRVAVHGRYLLLYRDLPDRVRIVRVVHGARDLRRLFETSSD